MKLDNSEIEFVQSKTVKIFDELIKSSFDNISEEEKDSKYNELVESVVLLVEEVVIKYI